MKTGTSRSYTIPRFGRLSHAVIVALALVVAGTTLHVRAGSIFDDDWTPPKPPAQQHTTPAQPPSVVPGPAPAATHPAVPPTPVQPVPAQQSPSRRAIPQKPDLARSRGLLKEAFAAQLKDRSVAGRKKLAETLLAEVPKAADNPVDQYVLLGGAIEASKEAASLLLCFQAADRMAAQYDVDALGVKIDAVLKVNLRGDSPAVAAENVKAAMGLIGPLQAAEDYPTAARILALARPAAVSDPALAAVIQKRIQTVETLRNAHDRFEQQLPKLKAMPDDPAANLAVGSYLSFSRGEWEKGLPMLAKSSDANLKQAADLEISQPTSAEDVIRLGDRWWDFGAKQPDAIRGVIDQHAVSFYKSALAGATGLRRTLLEHRIAEASELTPAAPSEGAADNLTNSLGMKFVRIKAGEFLMGSPPAERGHLDKEALHHVRLTKPFLMATTPVTQAQWKAVMGNNPSEFSGDDRPVEKVSWDDAVAFCEKLGAREGKHYRLPTEAEWEYACRAGGQTIYGGGDKLDEIGWYSGNSNGQTHPVAQKKPNAWGLYDMQGNVWEWCSNGPGPHNGDEVDPKGPANPPSRVARGGSFDSPPQNCRAAFRSGTTPDARNSNLGFRIVLEPSGNQASDSADKSVMTPGVDRDIFTNSIGMGFVHIKAGEFDMGSPADEVGHQSSETLHHVKISKPFMMATTTVTQAQWKTIMGNNPSHFRDDSRPVETVPWGELTEFCEKLGAKEGKRYRLPTEAEWEYSCRAGSQTAFGGASDLDEIGWYSENSNAQSHPVGQKKPNAWGLYDMQGNVWQLCSDGFGPYVGDAVDPKGPSDASFRVLRGGSWRTPALSCRAATRKRIPFNHREDNQGFRVALELPGD